jgi:hypothetical protein
MLSMCDLIMLTGLVLATYAVAGCTFLPLLLVVGRSKEECQLCSAHSSLPSYVELEVDSELFPHYKCGLAV